MMTYNYCRKWTMDPVTVNNIPAGAFLDAMSETYEEDDLQAELDKYTIKTRKGKNGKTYTSMPVLP
jgi:hypothetical protein